MLDHVPQGRLLGTLPLDPITQAMAWIGCQTRPETPANVWYNARGDFEGALIDCEWGTYQLVATTRDALLALLERLPARAPHGWRLTFPEWATRDVTEKHPYAQVTYEILHLCRAEDYRAPGPASATVMRLTPELAEQYVFDLEMVKAMSGFSWQGVCPLYAALADDQVVSIADGSALSEYASVVQGVYTLPDYRRRGLARSVVARLTEEIFALGRVSLYAAEYTNYASLGLCRALGYKPVAVAGLAQFEP